VPAAAAALSRVSVCLETSVIVTAEKLLLRIKASVDTHQKRDMVKSKQAWKK
jgi:hypothetical protein